MKSGFSNFSKNIRNITTERETAPVNSETAPVNSETTPASNGTKNYILNKDANFHFRIYDDDGNLSSHGGATVIYRVVSPKKAYMVVSVCSTNDVYNRTRGRMICEGRLAKFRVKNEDPQLCAQYHITVLHGPADYDTVFGISATIAKTAFRQMLDERCVRGDCDKYMIDRVVNQLGLFRRKAKA